MLCSIRASSSPREPARLDTVKEFAGAASAATILVADCCCRGKRRCSSIRAIRWQWWGRAAVAVHRLCVSARHRPARPGRRGPARATARAISLLIGIGAALIAAVLGVTVGAFAGYLGGRIDDVLTRTSEYFQTIPTFLFAMVLVAVLAPSIGSVTLAIGLTAWPEIARLTRAEIARSGARTMCSRP